MRDVRKYAQLIISPSPIGPNGDLQVWAQLWGGHHCNRLSKGYVVIIHIAIQYARSREINRWVEVMGGLFNCWTRVLARLDLSVQGFGNQNGSPMIYIYIIHLNRPGPKSVARDPVFRNFKIIESAPKGMARISPVFKLS